MPGRSLRVGTRLPNPGAVLKGCSRPKALRFDSPLGGGLSPFGDGSYSGNIMQGGVPLQPQDYLLDGVTPLPHCIVVTGAATVAPDAETGAAVAMARHVVAVGASASLAPSGHCKGLLLVCRGGIYARGGGKIITDRLGRAGDFGDLTLDMLMPRRIRSRVARRHYAAYVVRGDGAAGAAPAHAYGGVNAATATVAGLTGSAAGPMQSGGGGSGGAASNYGDAYSGPGGKGGPCCGGAGGGAAAEHGFDGRTACAAGDHGGPGGDGISQGNTDPKGVWGAGAGGGDPLGTSTNAGITPTIIPPTGAGGALLGLIAPTVDIDTGCRASSDGATGGYVSAGIGYGWGGGGTGGGPIVIITKPGGYHNAGTVRAAGGLGGQATGGVGRQGGPGGAGSVNVFELDA